ncbi:hypothetical protein HA402_001456 [Bradysia odoriphaga]|nr:hypothetical protein HA402_001456 [Bradysia odoriphaga]
MTEEIKVSFIRSKTAAETLAVQQDQDIMVIARYDDLERFFEKATVPRIFVIKRSDDEAQYLEYISNYIGYP